MSYRDKLVDEFMAIAKELGDDELDMAVEGARRLLMGRTQYGELCLATDKRDPMAEASPELADYFVYKAWASLKARHGQ
jgi:hypothetical protein